MKAKFSAKQFIDESQSGSEFLNFFVHLINRRQLFSFGFDVEAEFNNVFLPSLLPFAVCLDQRPIVGAIVDCVLASRVRGVPNFAADIAEFVATSALDLVAARHTLDPMLTIGAFLVLVILDQSHRGLPQHIPSA